MINLLPYDQIKQLRAARANVILARYIIVLLVSTIFLAGCSYGVYLINNGIKNNADASNSDTAVQNSESVALQKKAGELQTKINKAKSVFASEIKYSDVLVNIAKALPNGVILDKIALSGTSFSTPIEFSAYAQTFEIASSLKDKLSASQQFTGVTLTNTTRVDSPPFPEYPISVKLSVTYNKGV